ncbi:hypothetical protein Mvan_2064 [Mycolicibacterium vanbaalenii PYR-1]|uniref:Uncharacterized protein n=1 Tax=Mycolicibacterium vanbaalenii (strain DSM 7251 / JCM 13017 / BCRC 16820 / KCTC 9966 / NRRL B-24157 / PYR-1) TaxID=350058 RepID=A1T6T1_MYCVP|nr:hypothetical protein Mvan_2064 [Mycolicibacterium vanbaalenii PYR-1]
MLSTRRTASVSDMLDCCVNHATAALNSNGISPFEESGRRWFSAQNTSPGVWAIALRPTCYDSHPMPSPSRSRCDPYLSLLDGILASPLARASVQFS